MRNICALILLAILVNLSFAQTDGDYRWANTSSGFWNTPGKWEIYSGGGWSSTSNVPGITDDISYDVFITYNGGTFINLKSEITVTNTGRILVLDGGTSITLNVGLNATFVGVINLDGELVLDGGANSKLKIGLGNSTIIIGPTGKLSDNTSAGNITNASGADGIVIESSASSTGSFISNTSGISGTFDQYISNGQWHLISPIFSDVVSGDFWDGTNDAYLRPYNSPGGGWGDYISATDQALNVGEGYELWETAAFTYSQSGTFLSGNQTLPLSTGGSSSPDFCLIGNPYPCALDWASVMLANAGKVDGSVFFVYNGSTYLAHNGTTGAGGDLGDSAGDASSGYIPSMQGFFVKSLGSSDLTISNSNKVHPDVAYYKSSKDLPDYVHNLIELTAEYDDQSFTTVLYQQENATNGEDDIYDAPILFNNDPNFMDFYSFAGEKASCINIYNEYPYVVEMGLNIPEAGGNFSISLSDIQNNDATFSVILEDKSTGDMIDLLEQNTYSLEFPVGGSFDDRFLLHLNSTVGIDDLETENIEIYSYNNILNIHDLNSVNKQINVYDMLGKLVFSSRNSNEFYQIDLWLKSGYYIVEVLTEKNHINQKVYLN